MLVVVGEAAVPATIMDAMLNMSSNIMFSIYLHLNRCCDESMVGFGRSNLLPTLSRFMAVHE